MAGDDALVTKPITLWKNINNTLETLLKNCTMHFLVYLPNKSTNIKILV
jgi:hypothetical protein